MTNLRLVLRGLARTPVFTAVAILSLALGIGANTAIFSLLDQLLLRTLPVQNPHELVYLYSEGPWEGSYSADEPGGPSFSYPFFRELQRTQTPFVGLAGARNSLASLSFNNQASHGQVRLVSGNYFDLLGVRPAIGRLFTEDDDRTSGGHPLAILSYGYWSSRFGADVGVLNQTLLVNAVPMTIIGVTQRGFLSERLGNPPSVYAPISMKKEITPDGDDPADRKYAWVTLFGRLKPGMARERAEEEINVLYRAEIERTIPLLQHHSEDFLARFRARSITLKPGQHGRGALRDHWSQPLYLLMAMTLLVLLIACANVANLQLARGTARAREVSVRLAMGASRLRLIGQFLIESCVLALAGGALGILVALWTVHGILASIPAGRGVQGVISPNLDGRVLLFCLGLSLLTGIVFGLFPALRASKAELATSLKDQAGQISSTGPANIFRKTLVTAQVAISLLLLIAAGLFGRTLVNLARVDLGIRADHLLTFSVLPKLSGYSDERVAQFHDRLTDRLGRIPGVSLMSSARNPVVANSISRRSIEVEGSAPPNGESASSWVNWVGSDYFRTMGIPLIAGREFSLGDRSTAPKVAVVNEGFVRQFLPGQNALGRHVGKGLGRAEIVGVVKDANYRGVREAPPPTFYTPLAQSRGWDRLQFYVRTTVSPESVVPLIRREVAALDPHLPIQDMKTMQVQIEEITFSERILSALTATFAGLATLLAAIGLYGVLAFNVARRTREIGIRMALGADAPRVRGLVIREVALMLVIGTVAGLASAAASSQLVQAVLFGLTPWDAVVYGSAVALLWLVALGAAYLPARRATKVDPMVALRYE